MATQWRDCTGAGRAESAVLPCTTGALGAAHGTGSGLGSRTLVTKHLLCARGSFPHFAHGGHRFKGTKVPSPDRKGTDPGGRRQLLGDWPFGSRLREPLSRPVSPAGSDKVVPSPWPKATPREPHFCCEVLLDTPCHPVGGPRSTTASVSQACPPSEPPKQAALPALPTDWTLFTCLLVYSSWGPKPQRSKTKSGKGELTCPRSSLERAGQALPGAGLGGTH